MPAHGMILLMMLAAAFATPDARSEDLIARKSLADLSRGRSLFTALRLHDGRVLAAGGSIGNEPALRDCEIYDPKTNLWSRTAPLAHGRYNYRAFVAADGRAFVIGGRSAPQGDSLASVEVYDPLKRRWSEASPMHRARDAFALVAMHDGRILIIGGYDARDGKGHSLTETEIYDPVQDRWTLAAPMPVARWWPVHALLPDGRILVGGGSLDGQALRDAYFYDPRGDSWSAAPDLPTRRDAAETLSLPAGALVVGGYDDGRFEPRIDLFDTRTLSWATFGSLLHPRMAHMTANAGHLAAVIGGENHSGTLAVTEVYDSTNGRSRYGPDLLVPRAHASAVTLQDGRVLVVGGSQRLIPLATSEIIDLKKSREPGEPTASAILPPPRRTEPSPPREQVVSTTRRPERPHDFAVIIGVNRYQRLPNADYADQDARRMSDTLNALGVPEENSIILSGAKATLSEMTKYIEEWLPRRVGKDSRVYFFYSGHGAPDVKDGAAYLMPWDADASFVKSTGFSLSRLYDALGALPAREVIAVIDSCFSGSGGRSVLAPGLRPLVAVVAPTRVPPKLTVLTAAEKDEVAGSLPERGHGLFTYHVLQGLTGSADADRDGHTTVSELYAYARKRVILDARRQDREQTPTLATTTPKLRLY